MSESNTLKAFFSIQSSSQHAMPCEMNTDHSVTGVGPRRRVDKMKKLWIKWPYDAKKYRKCLQRLSTAFHKPPFNMRGRNAAGERL